MRALESESSVSQIETRVPSLSIVVDDFDLAKGNNNAQKSIPAPKVYTRSYSDASIKKILEEAEHRKHEFWKLLDEHNAVIENLKRIEKLEDKVM